MLALFSSDGLILWDTDTDEVDIIHDVRVRSAVWSHDGSMLAAGGDNGIHIWDTSQITE